jgi:hypothetical protein
MPWKRVRLVLISWALGALALPGTAVADSTTPLTLSGFGEIVVDGANEQVFVSGGQASSSIVVLDFDGNVVTTITGQQGATGMALDASTGTLYVALRNASAISKINTTTLAEVTRFATTGMSAPRWVALAGGRVWFSYGCMDSGGVGSAALDGTDLQAELGSASSCNRFAVSPTDANVLAASDVGGSSVFLYNVSSGSPATTSSSMGPGGSANIRQLLFTPDGADLFVASASPSSVQSFTMPSFTLSGSYTTGPYPIAAAVSADGAYVAGGADAYYNPDAFVFDAVTGDEIRRWEFGANGYTLHDGGLAFSPDNSRLFAVTKNPSTGKPDFRVLGAPTDPAAPTTISLSVSAGTVDYNRTVTLTANLVGAPGATVSIYATPYLGARTLVASGAVNASGDFTATYLVKKKTWFVAEFAGDESHTASTSTEAIVQCRALASVALSRHYGRSGAYKLYHSGTNPKIKGTVAPNHAGEYLEFVAQRYSNGAWRLIDADSFQITSTGSVYAILYASRLGKYRVRTEYDGDSDHLGDTSPWAYLKITR